MLHIAYFKMIHPEFYIELELEKENRIRQREVKINDPASKFRELEIPEYMKAWGVTKELK